MWQKNVLASVWPAQKMKLRETKFITRSAPSKGENGPREHRILAKLFHRFYQEMGEITPHTTLLVPISCLPRISCFPISLIPGSFRHQKRLRRQIGKTNAIKWTYFSLPFSVSLSLSLTVSLSLTHTVPGRSEYWESPMTYANNSSIPPVIRELILIECQICIRYGANFYKHNVILKRLWGRYYYFSFTNVEIMTQKRQITCPRQSVSKWQNWESVPAPFGSSTSSFHYSSCLKFHRQSFFSFIFIHFNRQFICPMGRSLSPHQPLGEGRGKRKEGNRAQTERNLCSGKQQERQMGATKDSALP